jgi:hypothetical protein
MVYYMASQFTITPIDLTDPTDPTQLSEPWDLGAHDCSISDDGTRGYFPDPINAEMLIVDTSEAQARIPGAQPRIVGRFPTPNQEWQQETVPLTYDGHPYVLLWTEAKTAPHLCNPGQMNFGHPRIVDVADEAHPVEVSKLLTEVMLPQNCPQVVGDVSFQRLGVDQADPGYPFASSIFVYDSHMCTPDRLHDPTIAACAQLGSGLRVYDIRDPHAPSEIAYFHTGTVSATDPTLDWAFARPVIRRDLGQVWWVTHLGGFHVAKFREGVWPFEGDETCPPGYDYFRAQYDLVYQACKAEAGT